MFSIIANTFMTATRTRQHRDPTSDWDVPAHWRRSEGQRSRGDHSRSAENLDLPKWYDITGPK